jgi:hypothetical protein
MGSSAAGRFVMKFATLLEALKILEPYAVDNQYCIDINCDTLCIGNEFWLLKPEERKRLQELGFSDEATGRWEIYV